MLLIYDYLISCIPCSLSLTFRAYVSGTFADQDGTSKTCICSPSEKKEQLRLNSPMIHSKTCVVTEAVKSKSTGLNISFSQQGYSFLLDRAAEELMSDDDYRVSHYLTT